MKSVLEAHNLSIGYRKGSDKKYKVLGNLNLSLYEGELVSLLGANGTGKSTLLRTLAGLQPPLSGDIIVNGLPLSAYGNKRLSKLISIVSTERTNAGGLTVRELVGLGRQPHTGFTGRLGAHDKSVVAKAMDDVGIAYKAEHFVAELSDGERQKVMVAKALAQEAPIIILDEPTAFLDAANRVEVLRLLHVLARENGKSILLSSHDVAQSLALSDRLWLLMPAGAITEIAPEDAVLSGKMSELFGSESVQFDMLSGEFLYKTNAECGVSVEGDDIMRHWCGNALRRNGFVIVAGSGCNIKISSPSALELTFGGEHIVFNSVEELTAHLVKLKKEGELWK